MTINSNALTLLEVTLITKDNLTNEVYKDATYTKISSNYLNYSLALYIYEAPCNIETFSNP